jgi:hypothetical protein
MWISPMLSLEKDSGQSRGLFALESSSSSLTTQLPHSHLNIRSSIWHSLHEDARARDQADALVMH